MYDALLPHCSYRRLAARLAYDWVRGRVALSSRLGRANWRHYAAYKNVHFRCNICGAEGRPFFDFPDLSLRHEHRIGELRETLQCRRCRATMRHRTLAAALLREVSQRSGQPLTTIRQAVAAKMADLTILDSDSLSPISALAASLPNYSMSSFQPSRPFDVELAPRHYNLNLEKMGFASAQFDLLLTSDVMEHVRDIDAAHAEIYRVLKPGGVYIFTVPFDPECATHHRLVDTSEAQDRFLVPPQYHGDPLSGGILAYRVFGRALFKDLAALGFQVEFLDIDDASSLIIHGDVFMARKGAAC